MSVVSLPPDAVRLRIAHITNYQVPGYGYDEIQLSREQVRMGHEVTILTSNFLHPAGLYDVLRRRFPQRKVDPRSEVVDGVRIERLPSREIARRVWIGGLERALMAARPDVVHIHNLLQFHTPRVALMRARGLYRGAIVVDDHMHPGFVRRTPVGRLFYATYRHVGEPILERNIDRFGAIAEDTRDYLRDECGVTKEIAVIPLGVDTDAFAPDRELRDKTRERLAIKPSDMLLLYTGKVIPEKGVHDLVEAAAALKSTGIPTAVAVVGDADEAYGRKLVASASAAHLDLHLVPSVDQGQLPEWYAAADIAVWPLQESKGVFEAISAGIPVVVSAASGLAHIVSPDFGFAYSPEDSNGLAASLRQMLSEDTRRRIGEAGRDFATRELSWSTSADRYVTLYRQAIAARGAGEHESLRR